MKPLFCRYSVLAAVVGLAGCAGESESLTRGYDAAVKNGVEQLREATRPYRTLDSAVAVGYPKSVPDCLVHESHGAMGYHHVNRGYVDSVLDVARPEILLYERLPDGAYRLNGVEFIVPYRLWSRDSIPPVIMGQKLKHEDNLAIWYLHVWAWTKNSDGLFADFNVVVVCPDSTRKVFKPSGA